MSQFALLSALPPEARLWIYTADRPLEQEETATILSKVRAFSQDWSSHGRPVLGAVDHLDNRFIGIAALVEEADISGCGIDKSVHLMSELAEQMSFSWAGGLTVSFRDPEGAIQVVSRPEFRKLVRSGSVVAETSVFDPSITTVAQLYTPGFERPMGQSWHATVFRLKTPAF